jgi:hypothetical protein
MTIGPGRIERAIAATFFANPSMTYTVEELVAIAYPGVSRVEKKHRVVVARAANKVAARECWSSTRAERPGHRVVYFNLLDHQSYAAGQIRGSYRFRELSHADVIGAIEDPNTAPLIVEQWREAMSRGGAFWREVESNRAKRRAQSQDE